MNELRLICTARLRQGSLLDGWQESPPPEDPSVPELVAALGAGALGDTEALWIYGGEPCLRADLPHLIAQLAAASGARIGLCSDGLSLGDRTAVEPLVRAGLQAVRLRFPCGRSDALDWLYGRRGAAKRVARAIRCCAELGLEVSLDVAATRATMPHLAETLKVGSRLGARAAVIRALEPSAREGRLDTYLTLAPRVSLLGPFVDEAVAQAPPPLAVSVRGIPACVLGDAARALMSDTAVRWHSPEGEAWLALRAAAQGSWVQACAPRCAARGCPGLPATYVARFGLDEVGEPPAATRLAARPGAEHDASASPEVASTSFGVDPEGRPESTREVRRRLVRIAGSGATVLRLCSPSLDHPAAVALFREALSLGFDRVDAPPRCSRPPAARRSSRPCSPARAA